MNNPFNYIPDKECTQAFSQLSQRLRDLKDSDKPEDINFCRMLDNGLMLGVLIAADKDGNRHTLFAFSGQLGIGGFDYPGFVEPVFDYLQPDGYFKTTEREISFQNLRIAKFEKEIFSKIKEKYDSVKARLDAEINNYREKCRLSKIERDRLRESGSLNVSEKELLIRQSQFEKAELHRLKKRAAKELAPFESDLLQAKEKLEEMKERRRGASEALQNWLFSNFKLYNAEGNVKSLSDIFAETPMRTPPSGAGECCAPKLLQAAYVRGWEPLSIAEYWYGKAKGGNARIHGEHYPACRGRCLPILNWMLRGLKIDPPLEDDIQSTWSHKPEIIFENRWFCVVNKPSGMLSVPGKRSDTSVQDWLATKYQSNKTVKVAHRLDQDTSGLLIATFGDESFSVMQSLFVTRKVRKIYVADLEGDYNELRKHPSGHIDLPLSPDWLDRPRQRIDFSDGKEAITDYEFISAKDGRSRILFYPHTGRTHQLRMHAAAPEGLGMPIIGDRLYGRNRVSANERLHLHAQRIEFTFPLDGETYIFESSIPF